MKDKTQILISLLFLSPSFAFGQMISSEKFFIENRLREIQPNGVIYYTDSTGAISDSEFINVIRLKLSETRNCKEKLDFTKKEIEEILSKLSRADKWDDSIFSNSKAITFNDATDLINNLNKKVSKPPLHYYYTFKKPFFLRNSTLCIFTLSAMCGSKCGYYSLQCYKLEDEKWIKLCDIIAGEF